MPHPDSDPSAHQTPDYGVDAPGVIRSLLGAGAALGALGAGALYAGRRLRWARYLVAPLLLGGAVSAGLGTSMIAYGARGKFRMRDKMLGMIAWRGDESVLDVGVGRGLLAVGAARRAPRGRVVGIDIWNAEDLSDNSRESTLRNLRAEDVEGRVELVDADARDLSRFPDAYFDVVLSLLCLHNIPDPVGREAACGEITRVLKPGGTALIGDYTATGSYVTFFEGAGLTVRSHRACFGDALGLMWLVEAVKEKA